MEALTPWETPINGFFVRSHHGVPPVDYESWKIKIDGLVTHPLVLTMKDLEKMPQVTFHAVLECSGNWRGKQLPSVPGVQWEKGAVGNAEWTGVRLKDILKKVGVKPNAKFVTVEGADKPAVKGTPAFIRSIPLSKIQDDAILALKMNRQPLPPLHGGPVRLVLPNWYGHNWMKWVAHLKVADTEDSGFYMAKGYRLPKDPVKPGEKWDSATGVPMQELRVQTVLTQPEAGEKVARGEITVRGKAFSGSGAITTVEVTTDGGDNWKKATLEPRRPSGGWQSFEATLPVKSMGKLTIQSRATDEAGNGQPLEPTWNPPGYLRNAADAVSVEVVEEVPLNEEGLLEGRCLTCHSRELVVSQRLSESAWEKTVTKMESFGLKLEAGEKPRLIHYLTRLSNEEPAGPAPTPYWVEESLLGAMALPLGKSTRGHALYQKNCAACHGPSGEGQSGPRLSGRDLPPAFFAAVVAEGRGNMPAFGQELKRQSVADIAAFLKSRK